MSNKKLRELAAIEHQTLIQSALYPSEISYLLYHADPLNTGCRENSAMENEYDQMATWLADELAKGVALKTAIQITLSDLFDEAIAQQQCPKIAAILQGVEAAAVKSKRQQNIDALHLKLFPECYDHLYDSIEDARIRRRGQDPMSVAYQETWQQKRRERGISETMFSPETEAFAVQTYARTNWVQVVK